MVLKNTLIGIEGLKAKGNLDTEINGIESDINNVKPGNMFVAIQGSKEDGHNRIDQAMENGATVIMVEDGFDLKNIKLKSGVTLVVAPNTRQALAITSCNFYSNPSTKFKLIGITGTKGKTTTTYMLKEILEKAGKKVGLICSIGTYINEKKILDNDVETLESCDIQKLFAKMVEEDVEYVLIEVSAKSLKLNKLDASTFDKVGITNLLDTYISEKEYESMEDYFEAKLQLFKMCNTCFINGDDFYCSKIPGLFPKSYVTTYGLDNFSNIMARDLTVANSYADFKYKFKDKSERVKVGICGRFSVYNALLAIAISKKIGIDSQIVKKTLATIKVPARCEDIENKKDITIMLDYANSPQDLASILQMAKTYTNGQVVCVLSCDENMDKNIRQQMGETAGKYAHYSIITSGNSQTEEPEGIIKDIENGISNTTKNYKIIVDRKQAITQALKMVHKRDMVIIAGKDHKMYQEIKGKQYPFDESKIIKEVFKQK